MTRMKENLMTQWKRFIAMAMFLLTGCSSVTTADYVGMEPKLDLRQYLNGKLEADGVLIDYSGKADRHFHVDMVAKWNGNDGTLQEDFTYQNGKKDSRVWTIKFIDDNNFTATAHDVIGTAVGSQNGNAVNMRYTLKAVRDDGSTIDLAMDDWMYLVGNNIVINRTKMRKYGIIVGELVLAFHKK